MVRKDEALAVLRMCRPVILSATVLANLAGLAMAEYDMGAVNVGIAVFAMAIALTATIMGHFLNEYADVDTDSITRRSLVSGGSGVLPSGIIPRSWALLGGLLFGFCSLSLTTFGLLAGLLSVSYVIIFAFALMLGYCYSMPPVQLERRGLGELDNAFLGTLMFLSGYLPQTGELSEAAVVRSVPIFLAIFVNLIGIHWADRAADEAVGKRTLIVRLGKRSLLLFPALLVATYLSVLLLISSFPIEMLMAYLLTIPAAAYAYVAFRRNRSPLPGSLYMVAILLANIIGWSI